MQEGVESRSQLVVAPREAAELLEPIEKAIYEVWCFVAMPVDVVLDRTIAARRDDGFGSGGFNRFDQGVDTGVDFFGQPTSRAVDRLIATVFLGVPADFWWVRTMVESMKSSSRSASPHRAWATRSQSPYVSQRAKRTYTECQLPNSTGKSRQGLPTRAVYCTASTNSRLSAAHPPLSVSFPGSRYSIRAHCASLNVCRSIARTQIQGCEHISVTVNGP